MDFLAEGFRRAWEALEDAGIDPASLRGTDTGVYVGASSSGYSRGVTGEYEAYRLTGTSHTSAPCALASAEAWSVIRS